MDGELDLDTFEVRPRSAQAPAFSAPQTASSAWVGPSQVPAWCMPQDVEGIEAPEVPDPLEVLYCGGVWEAPAHCPVLRRQAAVSAGQPRRRRRSCVHRALLLSRVF
jgi:hypothetical protein